MVRYTTNKELKRVGIVATSRQIFVQRWLELLDYRTVDSHAAKLLNANGVLQELCEVVFATLNDEIGKQHLPQVWAETRETIRDDPVVASHDQSLHTTIMKRLSDQPGADSTVALTHALHELQSLQRSVAENYLDWVLDSLESAFANDEPVAAEGQTSALVSELLSRRDRSSLYYLGKQLQLGEGSFERRWDVFTSAIKRRVEPMTVFVPLASHIVPTLRRHEQRLGWTIQDANEIRDRGTHLQDVMQRLENRYVAVIRVNAEDIRTAASRAISMLDQALDTFRLYYGKQEFHTANFAVVEYRGLRRGTMKAKRVEIPTSQEETSDRERQLVITLEVLASARPATRERLETAIQYLRLGADAHAPEIRFLNYWIALESLARFDGPVLTSITRYVPSVHCNQYIFQLARNFTDDCRRCGVDIDRLLGTAELSQAVRRLLDVIPDRTFQSAILRACEGHGALRMRAKSLIKSLEGGPRIKRLIQAHHKRMTWHLFRLYRIRNSIVHEGRTHRFTIPCTTHLEDYVYRLLTSIVFRLQSNPERSIQDVLADSYNDYERTLYALDHHQSQTSELVLGSTA